MISTKPCWINSERVTYRGASLFPASRWWWRGMNTKESKESEETRSRTLQLQSSHPECKLTLMNRDERGKTILSQLNKVNKLNNFSHSNLHAPDQFQTLEDFKKRSSQRWNSWKNPKTQLYPGLSRSVNRDQVHILELTWTNRTRL